MSGRVALWLTAVVVSALVVGACGGGAGGGAQSAIVGPEGLIFQVGGIVVDVPAGAVSAPTEMLVVPLSAAQLAVAPPDGLAVMAAGRFEANVAQFNLLVTIIMPLGARLPGGQAVPLWQLRSSAWEHSLWDAVVAAGGRTASTNVGYFTTFAVFADYAPLKVGASWTYRRTVQVTSPPGGTPGPEQSAPVTATITDTQTVGGLPTFVWSESAPSDTTLYLHRSTAPFELLLVATQQGSGPLELLPAPAKLLMLPPAAGQTWAVSSLFDGTAQAAVTAETVVVGGDEYDTMKVHIAPTSGQAYFDLWFAPQVGPVKMKQATVDPGVSVTVVEMDLQSYSIP